MAYFVDALIANYPKSSQLGDVLCNAGVSSLNSRDGKRSEKYLVYLVDHFPEHPLVPKSMYFIGRTKDVIFNDIEGAKAAYKILYRTFPKTNWSEIARSSIKELSNPLLLESVDDGADVDTTETK
jgi:TolA-binding protein